MIKTKISRLFKIKDPHELVRMPVIVTVNQFNENAAKEFKEAFQKAHDIRQPIIPVNIDSYGGYVYSLLSMVDTIANSDIPVATILSGKGMSCGAVLFTCGKEGYRFMGPNATMMIHDVSSMALGKIKDLKVDVNEAERLNKKIYDMMAKNVGKPSNYFYDLVQAKSRTDWFLTPEEAKEHNLANHVRIPNFKITCSVKIALE